MSMTDKAVSTEDLFAGSQKQNVPGVARLEAILHTLVENKVEALKNDNQKTSSLNSSPRNIFKRLKLSSKRNQSKRIEQMKAKRDGKCVKTKRKAHHAVNVKNIKRQALKQEVSISSPESQQYQCKLRSCEVSLQSGQEDSNRSINYDNIYIDNSCSSLTDRPRCCCNRDVSGELVHYDDEYISLKIEGFEDIETDAIISEEALRRARRKRRRRRKRKMKKRLAMHHAHLVEPSEVHDSFKNFAEDELSRRAKWTIVATACILLFMCVLLVGITLRMAPIIDEIVRKENEEFMNSITSHRNFSASVHRNVT